MVQVVNSLHFCIYTSLLEESGINSSFANGQEFTLEVARISDCTNRHFEPATVQQIATRAARTPLQQYNLVALQIPDTRGKERMCRTIPGTTIKEY